MVVNMEMRPCQRDSIDGDLERCRHPFIGAGAEGTNLVLTGQVPLILMVSATLAFPISFALIRLYRRAVLKTMTPTVSDRGSRPPPLETTQPLPIQCTRLLLRQISSITTHLWEAPYEKSPRHLGTLDFV